MTVVLLFIIIAFVAVLIAAPFLPDEAMKVSDWIRGQVAAFDRKKSDPPAKFRAWAEDALNESPELQAWLLSLSDEGFATLTQRVADFCADLNFQLSWLVERHLEVAPSLRQAAKTIVADYLGVCREAIRHQEEIALFREYHKLVANPADSRYRDIRHRLFTRLTADGLTEPLPYYELIMASEIQRQALAAKSIRAVADKDWNTFARIFGEVLKGIPESAGESPS